MGVRQAVSFPAVSSAEQNESSTGDAGGGALPGDLLSVLSSTHRQFGDLFQLGAGFDLRLLESSDGRVRAQALGELVSLAKRVVALFDVLSDANELGLGEGTTRLNLEQPAVSQGTSEQPVIFDDWGQVVHVARMEVTRVLERLSSAPSTSEDQVVFQGASLFRKVWRGIGIVDDALARALGATPRTASWGGPESSLRVRKLHAWFRRDLDVESAPRRESVQRMLRRFGTRIALLRGKAGYAELRPDDRVLFTRLQDRILDWLAQQSPSFEEGRRLWEDARAMLDILRQVNLRADLIAHDASLVRSLAGELATFRESEAVGEDFFRRLAPLEGLDEELDKSFAREQVPDRRIVERVFARADLAARSRGI